MNKNLQKYIITGLMSAIPIALTYWIIKNLFLFFSKPGQGIITFALESQNIKPEYIVYIEYLLGFILTILFLYILGLLVSNVLGKRIYKVFEKLLNKIPIVSNIYKSIKQITSTLSMPQSKAFQKVVLIQYPRKGLWTICMVTGETKSKDGLFYNVFVPTTPNPTSGYLLFVKSSDTKPIDLTVEEGLKIIISGGMIGPENIDIR